MPRLNLRDHDQDFQPEDPEKSGSGSEPTPPHLDDYDDGSGRKTPWIVLAAVIVLIGVVVVALNQLHVIQLWGKKPARVVESLEPALPPPDTLTSGSQAQQASPESNPAVTETTPLPNEPSGAAAAPKGAAKTKGRPSRGTSATAKGPGSSEVSPPEHRPAAAPSAAGTAGSFAVQVSSWPSRGRADRIASSLGSAGFNAYVEQADVAGKTWYRVRVGKFASAAEANQAVSSLKDKGYAEAIVVK